jgi:hypothetical protein
LIINQIIQKGGNQPPHKGTFTVRRDRREREREMDNNNEIIKMILFSIYQMERLKSRHHLQSFFFIFYTNNHRPSPLYSRTKKGEDPGCDGPIRRKPE